MTDEISQRNRARKRLVVFAFVLSVVFSATAALVYRSMLADSQRAHAAIARTLAQRVAIETTAYVGGTREMLAQSARAVAIDAAGHVDCSAWLAAVTTPAPGTRVVELRDGAGKVVCSARPWLDTDPMPATLAAPRIASLSGPYIAADGAAAIVALRLEREGRPFTLAASLDLLQFWPLIDMHAHESDVLAGVANADGVIAAHSDTPKRWIGARITNVNIDEARIVNFDTDRRLLAFSPIADTGWFAYAGISAPDALQDEATGWRVVATICLTIAAIAVIAAWIG